MSNRQSGTVKWFNDEKGFGGITPADGGPEIPVHHKDIESDGFKAFQVGQKVSFVAEKGNTGMKACQVRAE
ncbi:cold-shock protein [Pseudomonas atacamensis]|jgi:CspA family cold shock protein|uniref:cold-shock protein n=1 Tax=Pseudomonas atacamensis TaxID=2565368 RepID=UPI0019CFE32F|nr:cold shock domain-containing protein [Pseudomonas atacamensis]MDT6919609.1 cold shock domain-containing protein [Pseudomonas atacamensis]MEB2858991.1 cold shock domain-containing protein [Pseudomonas atacamensis]QSL88285.1 cold shock domain-containing protein [Pseudomonas atacamensis]